MEYRGIVCEHCSKFLDLTYALGYNAIGLVVYIQGVALGIEDIPTNKRRLDCPYCKETVEVSPDREVRLISRDDANQAVFPWSIEDVHEKASRSDEELTDDEAREVLRLAVKHHDAEIGINWDVLGVWIDEVISERKVK